MGLAANTSYAYKVIATNSAGDSLPAGPVSAVTPIPPGAPTNLRVTSIGATMVTLSWQAPANVTGYQITRQIGAGSPQVVGTLAAGATSFSDSGLVAGSVYQYVVTASNVSGTGAGSTLSVTTLPLAPTGLTSMSSQNQISLSWTASASATRYNIYRGTSSGAQGATPIATGIVGTTYIDPSLVGGTTYYYVVTALNAGGEGARSGETSAKIIETIPAAPTGLTAGTTQGQVTLSWSAKYGVTSYRSLPRDQRRR